MAHKYHVPQEVMLGDQRVKLVRRLDDDPVLGPLYAYVERGPKQWKRAQFKCAETAITRSCED